MRWLNLNSISLIKRGKFFLKPPWYILSRRFAKTPEVFNAVDMSLLVCKGFVMTDTSMLETFEVKSIIDSIAVGVNPGLGPHMGFYGPMKGLPVEALGKDHPNLAVTLQKTENRDFSAGATSPLPLTDTAEVGLVNLYLTGKLPDFLLPIGGYTGPYAWNSNA